MMVWSGCLVCPGSDQEALGGWRGWLRKSGSEQISAGKSGLRA
jgi:hypothetical protein